MQAPVLAVIFGLASILSGNTYAQLPGRSIPATEQRFILNVKGMTCSACEGHVEAAVKKLHGVHSAKASLATDQVTIQAEPNAVTRNQLIKAIDDAGYKASPATSETETKHASGSAHGCCQ